MLSRLSQILFSFFTSRFEGLITATLFSVAQQILHKGRITLFVIVCSFVFSILLTAGIIISTLEAAAQYDARGTIFFTALLTSSLMMIGFSVIALAFIFWPREAPAMIIPPQVHVHDAHPFEEILMAAITEGVQYFKDKTQHSSKTRPNEYSQA